MPEPKHWFLVMYDVREPKRLRRAAKHLEGYGHRLQYSVFRCRLTHRQIERLQWELTKMLETEDDLLIIELCQGCGTKVADRNGQEDWKEGWKGHEIV
ncbi:MAG: CRISPR-associated endonuclease Cas2 [Candidatus Poribacteria bacterium]|nr:CRISPR-associated endonuclease Cas2 [Candidatus Poribacteria bacterium]